MRSRQRPSKSGGQWGNENPGPSDPSTNPASPFDARQPFGAMTFPQQEDLGRKPSILKLLKRSAPVVIVVALAGFWFTGLFVWTMFSKSQIQGDNVSAAVVQYERQESVTRWFPQPWLGQYNLGTALLMSGDIEGGLQYLSLAYEGVPKAIRSEQDAIQPFSYECMVRMNLSAAKEMQGDAEADLNGAESAAEFYEEALEWVSPCEVPPSTGESDASGEDDSNESNEQQSEQFGRDGNQAGDRLREKLGQDNSGSESNGDAQGGSNEDSNGDTGGNGLDPFEGESAEERERREQLEGKNQEQAERQRENEESTNRGGGSRGW